MKTKWDYTNLADAYLKRPNYSEEAINELISKTKIKDKSRACDVGAGVAHLTLMLAKKGFQVAAVEPNLAMRNNGIKRTSDLTNVSWYEGTGENTGQESDTFDLVTFGSSFNVCDRQKALNETARILKPNGWFFCLWNHRDLSDPIQSEIESIIRSYIDGYGYGSRRENQTPIINESGLFGDVSYVEGNVTHSQSIDECVEAWRSHATLQRQAGEGFSAIISSIETMLLNLNTKNILIPYTTRAWISQLN
ncbi:methyltransferase domain-containing protein [bacterium]|nr:methyltransferase domain-containing protein [bacterium]